MEEIIAVNSCLNIKRQLFEYSRIIVGGKCVISIFVASRLEKELNVLLKPWLYLFAVVKLLEDTKKSSEIRVFVAHIRIQLLELLDHVHKIIHGIGKDSGT